MIGYVASSHNQFDGLHKYEGDTPLENGAFVEIDTKAGTAKVCAEAPTATAYFVAQEDTRQVDNFPDSTDYKIEKGKLLKLMAPQRGLHIVTDQADALELNDQAHPSKGKLVKGAGTAPGNTYIVREIKYIGDKTAYRCECVQ